MPLLWSGEHTLTHSTDIPLLWSGEGELTHSLYPKHLHHLISKVIDDFDGNPPDAGFSNGREVSLWSVSHASTVNLRFQRRLERFVGVVRAEEIGVTHEKTLRVIVGIDEPAGDAVGAVAPNFTRVGMKNINTVDQNL